MRLLAGRGAHSLRRRPEIDRAGNNRPIVIGTAPQTRKIIKTHFEVLRMMYQAIQVRSLTDMREIHTFTYAPEIRDQMQRVFNAGGYQYGDKVVVWYQAGASVAVKIKGKPSKPN